MKKILSLALIAIAFVSCSEDTTVNNFYGEVEERTVEFSAKSFITESESPFQAKGGTFDNSYVHQLPTTFKAYFVADENKGQYSIGQVVKVYDVANGQNTITIPKMKFKVYVTNYLKPNGNEMNPNAWYVWNDAIAQMPQTTTELYMYGKNDIDYTTNVSGQVEVKNPYAAVMIKNNVWVSGAPTSYDTNQAYALVGNNSWYNLYIRNTNTNTKIPINIPGNPNQSYTLSKTIQANKIFQYTIDGNVIEDDGNLNIVTVPFENGTAEVIKPKPAKI